MVAYVIIQRADCIISNASGALARSALSVCTATSADFSRGHLEVPGKRQIIRLSPKSSRSILYGRLLEYGPMNLFFTRHFHKLTRLRDESRAPCSLKIVEKYRKKKRTNGTRVDNAWYTWTPPETAPSRAIPRGETEAYEPVHSTQVAATGQLHHDLIGYRLYERFRTLSNLGHTR